MKKGPAVDPPALRFALAEAAHVLALGVNAQITQRRIDPDS
jgi:hypothetical protein